MVAETRMMNRVRAELLYTFLWVKNFGHPKRLRAIASYLEKHEKIPYRSFVTGGNDDGLTMVPIEPIREYEGEYFGIEKCSEYVDARGRFVTDDYLVWPIFGIKNFPPDGLKRLQVGCYKKLFEIVPKQWQGLDRVDYARYARDFGTDQFSIMRAVQWLFHFKNWKKGSTANCRKRVAA